MQPAGREDVYCTTEKRTNSIICNGLVAAQCGEQPLLPYDVCNLGSINLGKFVREGFVWGEDPMGGVDWEGLRQVVHHSTHFLDNVIDANRYPIAEITDLAQRIRRVGLGVMGWADMLVRLGIPYASPEGVEMGRRVMEFLNEEARNASEKLAENRGVFPEWAESVWGPDDTCARDPDGNRIRPERRLRNCNITTVAPTGTISIFAGCSGGIEPLYAVAFMRNQAGALMPDVNPDFVRMAKDQGWYSEELMERIATEGHIHFEGVPEDIQRVFVTAHDIHSRVACPDAGRLPGTHRFGHFQDHQLLDRSHRGGCPGDLPTGVQPGVQRRHRVPGRFQARAGAVHRQDGEGR